MRKILALLGLVAAGTLGVALAGTGSGTNYSTTPNMLLLQPTPGVCGGLGVEPSGRSWLELINTSFSLIDRHDHSPGHGQPVPASALNINADLPFGGYNATALRSARFGAISTGSLGSSDLAAIFVSGTDLYFVDGSGNVVRITSGGGLAGTPGSIGGLVSPAAATYTPASRLFSFTYSSGYAAALSAGPLKLVDSTVSGGQAVSLTAPAGLASSYALTMPSALPGSTSLVTLGSTGSVGAVGTVTGSNIAFAGALGVSGTATFGSSVTLNGSGAQSLAKTGGVLQLATADANDVWIGTGSGTKIVVYNAGGVSLNGYVLQGVGAPSLSNDAATKGYVDGKFPVTFTGNAFGCVYAKDPSGFVHLRGSVPLGSFGSPQAFLPAGYRPSTTRAFPVSYWNGSAYSTTTATVDAGGTFTWSQGGSVGAVYCDGITFYAEQ